MYALLMESTNGNDEHDPLLYRTVPSKLQPHVHLERVDNVNTVVLYYTATVVQEGDRKIVD